MAPHVVFATKFCRNVYFSGVDPGKKLSPGHEAPGGAGVVALPWLRRLGVAVTALGRRGAADPLAGFLADLGIENRLEVHSGGGAVNAVIGFPTAESTVLRVVPDPADWEPTAAEGCYLSNCRADAVVLAGSLPHGYAEFLIDTAAARGQRIFWNAHGGADLRLARDVGQVVLQVAYSEFGDGRRSPGALASELLHHSGADVCVVTAASRGSWTASRAHAPPLHTPALLLPLDSLHRTLGAGDAHFAALVAGCLLAPGVQGLERALRLARTVAAYHVAGIPGGSWQQLELFERQWAPTTPRSQVA